MKGTYMTNEGRACCVLLSRMQQPVGVSDLNNSLAVQLCVVCFQRGGRGINILTSYVCQICHLIEAIMACMAACLQVRQGC
jgi:hypothetical protein